MIMIIIIIISATECFYGPFLYSTLFAVPLNNSHIKKQLKLKSAQRDAKPARWL